MTPYRRAMLVLALINVLWLVLFVVLAAPARGEALRPEQRRAKTAIVDVWPRHLERAAVAVSWCESRWYIHARNGQYAGLFQVSAHWRRTVRGWGSGAYAQARHALAVFRRTGSTWRHWTCRWAA